MPLLGEFVVYSLMHDSFQAARSTTLTPGPEPELILVDPNSNLQSGLSPNQPTEDDWLVGRVSEDSCYDAGSGDRNQWGRPENPLLPKRGAERIG
jgi:hypothetical protein